MKDSALRALDAVRRWIRERASSPLRIVAARQLNRGAAIFVADIDGKRLVFATTEGAIGLLASYPAPGREAASQTASKAKNDGLCQESRI